MDANIMRMLRLLFLGFIFVVSFIFLSQAVQFYAALVTISPVLAGGFLVVLAGIIGYTIIVPLFVFKKMPETPPLPEEGDQVAYINYRKALIDQLNHNKELKGQGLVPLSYDVSDEQLEEVLQHLNDKAEGITKRSASQVFVTTAISQNGSLDALFVLVRITRMVWEIAVLYQQRPNYKNLLTLYFNVAATVLLAREIDDLELLDEQLEPLISALFGSTLSSFVPGAAVAANLLINSTVQGTANAYLTLRVGIIAQQYSSSLVKPERVAVKRSAAIKAVGLLGIVVRDNAGYIRRAAVKLSKKSAEKAYGYSKDQVFKAAKMPKDYLDRFRKTEKPTDQPE